MHLPDGVLSPTLAGGTWLVCLGGLAISLRRIDYERAPRMGVWGSVFFVASLIAIPFPPTSVHLLLNGLMGLLLGWGAFPAIFLALFLQAIQFAHGGLSSLGANTLVMAVPALLVGSLFRSLVRQAPTLGQRFVWAFLTGMGSVCFSCLLQAGLLFLCDRTFWAPAVALFVGHLPVMIVDGILTGWIVHFLARVEPSLLEPPERISSPSESPSTSTSG